MRVGFGMSGMIPAITKGLKEHETENEQHFRFD